MEECIFCLTSQGAVHHGGPEKFVMEDLKLQFVIVMEDLKVQSVMEDLKVQSIMEDLQVQSILAGKLGTGSLK